MPKKPERKQPVFWTVKEFDVEDDISLVDEPANRTHFLAIKQKEVRMGEKELDLEELVEAEDEEESKAANPCPNPEDYERRGKDAEGVIAKIYGILKTWIGKAKPEEGEDYGPSPTKKPVPGMEPETKKKEVVLVKSAEPQEKEETVAEDWKAELAKRDGEISDLRARLAESDKSAKRTAIMAKIDKWVDEGLVAPAARKFIANAILGEAVTEKSADGSEETTDLELEEALEKFVETNKPVPLGEVSKAAVDNPPGVTLEQANAIAQAIIDERKKKE